MNIWAHRRRSYVFPENTLEALETVCKLSNAGIELDIRPTSDGRMVVIHDEKVDRKTDGEGEVRKLPLSNIKKLIKHWNLHIKTSLPVRAWNITPFEFILNTEKLKCRILSY